MTMAESRFVDIQRTITSAGTVVSVRGELDVHACPQFRRTLIAGVVTGGVIEVDLSEVTFVDSAALSALVDGRTIAAQYRGELRLSAVGPTVARLLSAAGVDGLFPLQAVVA